MLQCQKPKKTTNANRGYCMRNAAAVMMVMAEWWRWEGLNFDSPAARSPRLPQNRGVPYHQGKPFQLITRRKAEVEEYSIFHYASI